MTNVFPLFDVLQFISAIEVTAKHNNWGKYLSYCLKLRYDN